MKRNELVSLLADAARVTADPGYDYFGEGLQFGEPLGQFQLDVMRHYALNRAHSLGRTIKHVGRFKRLVQWHEEHKRVYYALRGITLD